MNIKYGWFLFATFLLLCGCTSGTPDSTTGDVESEIPIHQEELEASGEEQPERKPETNGEKQSELQAESSVIADPPASPETFVRVHDYIPDIQVDLRYATENNFTSTVIYDYTDAWLRYGTVLKLAAAQEALTEQGYCLCIWDAFRSAESQDKLWEVYPNGNYVANPANGYSGHTYGDTVDLTLVTLDGVPVDMPSEFDDFTAAADRDYSDVTEAQAEAASILEQAMEQSGFTGYDKEWWHYSDEDAYPPELEFIPPAD